MEQFILSIIQYTYICKYADSNIDDVNVCITELNKISLNTNTSSSLTTHLLLIYLKFVKSFSSSFWANFQFGWSDFRYS